MILVPRRIPRADELDPLMAFYGYRFTRTGGVAGAPERRDADVVAAASAHGWPVGTTEIWTSGEVLERSVAAADALDEDAVLGAFVAGLGSAPRGRQTVISFAWARYLDAAPVSDGALPDCGLDAADGARYEVDVTERLLRLALGWSWNELPSHYLPDLEAAVSEGLPGPSEDDRERLAALLDVVASQPDGTTPGALEKAVASAKILPGTDKYQRYGILTGLAEFGVLPSRSQAPSWDRFVSATQRREASAGTPMRSDITMPLAGWRGGVDQQRAARLLSL